MLTMRTLIIFSGLFCVSIVQSGCVKQARRPCEELADALLDLLNGPEVKKWTQYGYDVPQMITWATSINVNNTDQAEEVVCNVAGVDSATAIQYLDESGILEAVTRRVYDVFVMQLQQMRTTLQYLTQMGERMEMEARIAQLSLDILDTLEEMGFFNLDPEGIQESQGYARLVMAFINREPWPPAMMSRRSTENCEHLGNCERLKQLMGQAIDLLRDEPEFQMYARQYAMATGIDLLDSEAEGDTTCEIAESGSIRDIVDAIKRRGVYTHILESVLGVIRANGAGELSYFEKFETMTDEQLAMRVGEDNVEKARARWVNITRVLRAMRELGML